MPQVPLFAQETEPEKILQARLRYVWWTGFHEDEKKKNK